MRVLLIAVNQEKYPYPVQPIGLAYIASALKSKGHEAKVLDLCFVNDFRSVIADQISLYSPDVIGFSIRNIDSTSYPETIYYLPKIKEIVTFCKEHSSAQMIVGGSGFSIDPEEILNYLDLNLGVVGEGEQTFCDMLDHVSLGQDVTHLKGIAYNDHGVSKVNDRDIPDEIDKYVPAREFFDVKKYVSEGSITGIQSKRGCHFNCIYCTYPVIEGRTLRLRNPEDVVNELSALYDIYGIDSFCFVDNVFNFPIHHAMDICQAIIKKGLKIQWTGFFHPKYITKELVSLLVQAGCSGVELGIDSASDKILAILKKGFASQHIIDAISLCKQSGLNVCCCLILGGPGETLITLEETFAVMDKSVPHAILAYTGIRIYPNTELEKIALQEGYSLDSYLEPKFYISEELQDNLVSVIQEFAQTHASFIYGGIPNDIPLDFLKRMRKRGVKGPLWELKSKFSQGLSIRSRKS
ncbi:MAG: radical SAM protein [Desulfobacterales bacterium]|nr:radical SAM protein [Desulfobacterales bacterium]